MTEAPDPSQSGQSGTADDTTDGTHTSINANTSSALNEQPAEARRVHRFDTMFPVAYDGSYLGPSIGEMAQRIQDVLAMCTAESGRRVVLKNVRQLTLNEHGAGLGNGEDVYEVLVGFEDYSWLYPHTEQEVLAVWTMHLTLTSGLGWFEAHGEESTRVTPPHARADVWARQSRGGRDAAEPAPQDSLVSANAEGIPDPDEAVLLHAQELERIIVQRARDQHPDEDPDEDYMHRAGVAFLPDAQGRRAWVSYDGLEHDSLDVRILADDTGDTSAESRGATEHIRERWIFEIETLSVQRAADNSLQSILTGNTTTVPFRERIAALCWAVQSGYSMPERIAEILVGQDANGYSWIAFDAAPPNAPTSQVLEGDSAGAPIPTEEPHSDRVGCAPSDASSGASSAAPNDADGSAPVSHDSESRRG